MAKKKGTLPHFFEFIGIFITRSVAFHSFLKTELTLVVYLSVSVLEKPLFNPNLINGYSTLNPVITANHSAILSSYLPESIDLVSPAT